MEMNRVSLWWGFSPLHTPCIVNDDKFGGSEGTINPFLLCFPFKMLKIKGTKIEEEFSTNLSIEVRYTPLYGEMSLDICMYIYCSVPTPSPYNSHQHVNHKQLRVSECR